MTEAKTYYVIKFDKPSVDGEQYFPLEAPRHKFTSRLAAHKAIARKQFTDARVVKVKRKPRQVFAAYEMKREEGFTRTTTYTDITIRVYSHERPGKHYTLKVSRDYD